jgi:hypothetical protein
MNTSETSKIFDKLTIAQYAGMLFFIVALETRVVSRPVIFLVGPFVVWLGLFLAAPPPMRRERWRRSLLIAAMCSIFLYAIGPYISK